MQARKIWVVVAITVTAALAALLTWSSVAGARLASARAAAAAVDLPGEFGAIPVWLERKFGPVAIAENGAPEVRAAAEALGDALLPDFPWPEDGGPLPAVPAAAAIAVEEHADVLARLDQARTATRFRLDIDWTTAWHEVATDVPVLDVIRLGDLVRLDAALAIEAGDSTRLRAGVARMRCLARTFEETPLLVAAMARVALSERGDDLLRRLLVRSADPLAQHAELAPPTIDGALSLGAAGEAAFLPSLSGALAKDLGVGPRTLLRSGILNPWLRADEARLLTAWARMADLGRLPRDQRVAAARGIQRDVVDHGGWLAGLVAVDATGALATEIAASRRLAVTAIGARALAFAREHGRWPNDADELGDPEIAEPMVRDGDALVIGVGDGAWRLTR